jgi:RNA polymerase sigma-70 factor (ECF subfamily)
MHQAQFESEVMVHKNKMFRFALSYCKDEDDAKDVVQDVLVKLWETREDVAEKLNIEAWCMTLTRNKSLDLMKRVGKKRKSNLESVSYDLESRDESPSDLLQHKQSYQKIMDTLKCLPGKQKATFHLREIEGLSYIEIGEILKIDMNQVKVNIHRARKALRKKLEREMSYGHY